MVTMMMIMAMMKQNEAAGLLKQSVAAEPLTFFLTHDAPLLVKHARPERDSGFEAVMLPNDVQKA